MLTHVHARHLLRHRADLLLWTARALRRDGSPMTTTQGNDQPRTAAAGITMRRTVEELFRDSDLQVSLLPAGADICNPHDADKGQVHIDFADGFVSWEQPAWEFWGILEPLADQDEDEPTVPVQQIIDTLS
jgi:hypothetical protein